MILFIDGDVWSFPPQRGFLQELLQSAGYAGCWGVPGIIWDPVSILGWGWGWERERKAVGQDG